MQKLNTALNKYEIKGVLEWSLSEFRANIYFSINSVDGLKHPKF